MSSNLENPVRKTLLSGGVAVGCSLGLGSPNLCELASHIGFEWIIVETEHNALDISKTEHMLMAMSGGESVPMVRLPSGGQEHIQRALDIGAMGMLLPMISNRAQAEAVVSASRYPPHGIRGFGPFRASHYMLQGREYFEAANENILIAVIIETAEAVRNLDEIAAVDGIDVLYLGPFDMCLSMGLDPYKQPHPEIGTATEQLLAACKRHGKAAGTTITDPAQFQEKVDQGFRMIGYADYLMFANAAREALKQSTQRHY